METLTKKICIEYFDRMEQMPKLGFQNIGPRRELRIELQERCGIPEIAALNICNGHYWDDYIRDSEIREMEAM